MKAFDDGGQLLASEFDVERNEDGTVLTFHARYGTRGSGREVNIDYHAALEIVLTRLCSLDAAITEVIVDSRVARALPLNERLLPLSYPVRLSRGVDVARIRRDITESQRKVARLATASPKGGNNHKRMRITLTFLAETEIEKVRGVLTGSSPLAPANLVDAARVRVPRSPSFDPYREAVPVLSISPIAAFSIDPGALKKALAEHANIQNALADFIRARGLVPVSPGANGPEFDLGWLGNRFTVAEIKSFSGMNVERQLRLGLGQVLQYRTMLSPTTATAGAVLAVAHAVDDLWVHICSSVDVILTWPPDWPRLEKLLIEGI